ncbi:MAG: thioredoxin fold domain-containing protein [Alistipes sp.]|nr:thioredoxin fold domain-containing protein [Alistipes sp.]
MKSVKSIFMISILGCALFATLNSTAQVRFEKGGIKSLKERAVKESKYIFVSLYADWCNPCRAMYAEVYSNGEVGEYINKRFVSARFNVDREPGRSLAMEYGVRGIPAFLLFDEEYNLLGGCEGYLGRDEFIESVGTLLREEE